MTTDPERSLAAVGWRDANLRCIEGLEILSTPFLPRSSQTHRESLGHDRWIAGPLEFRQVNEPGGGAHTGLAGDSTSWVGRRAPRRLRPGQCPREPGPAPLFAELDPAEVVTSEPARMERSVLS